MHFSQLKVQIHVFYLQTLYNNHMAIKDKTYTYDKWRKEIV